LLEVFTELERW